VLSKRKCREKVGDHEVAPVVKSKKIRSQKQIEALEKGRLKRIENARLKKEGKISLQKETEQGEKVGDFSRKQPSTPEPPQAEENLAVKVAKVGDFSREQPQTEVEPPEKPPTEENVKVDKVSKIKKKRLVKKQHGQTHGSLSPLGKTRFCHLRVYVLKKPPKKFKYKKQRTPF